MKDKQMIDQEIHASPRPARVGMTIGDLARRTGLNIETIRYYERIGLFPAPERTSTGRRSFQDEHLKRLFFIKRSRDLGFTLKDIGTLLSLRDQPANCTRAAVILEHHLQETRSKLRDLTSVEEILASALEGCRGGSPNCTFLQMIELVSEKGSFSSCCNPSL